MVESDYVLIAFILDSTPQMFSLMNSYTPGMTVTLIWTGRTFVISPAQRSVTGLRLDLLLLFFFAKLIHLGLLPAQIRANALSGDCRWTRELDRHIWSFAGQRQMCARRRAALSLSQHPSLRDRFADEGSAREAAGKVIDEVWESCWNDSRPFDEIY